MALRLHPAINNLRRAPGFAALVVVTLALGIGATTAMFSVVDAVLIRPLPSPHAARLSEIWTLFEGDARAPGGTASVLAAIQQERELFDAVSGYQFGSGTLTGTPEPALLSFASLSPDVFGIFPTAPLAGRLLTAADVSSAEAVVVISETLWTRHFGRDPAVIDRFITIDDTPQRVVGVLPSRFKFPESTVDAWRPLRIAPGDARARVQLLVLRRSGVNTVQVNDRLKVLTTSLQESGALPKGQLLMADEPVQVRIGRSGSSALYLLLGAVGILLIVACVNVSNLMLVRASSRHSELALRAAIGAGRPRLLREAAVESFVLAVLGGALGVWTASGVLDVILGLTPEQLLMLARASDQLDARAVAFSIAVTATTCLVFGIVPAWRASRIDPIDALKQQSRSTAGRRDDWWQGALVSAQLALVVVLLAGAGLLLKSFIKLHQVDLGFRTEGLALMQLQLTAPRYATPGAAVRFMQEVESRVEAQLGLPATIASSTPLGFGIFFDAHPEAEGITPPPGTAIFGTSRVAPDYFEVFEIPLLAGRTLEAGDGANALVVNEKVARQYWGETSPIGKRFRLDRNLPWSTVVGVTRDVKARGPIDAMEGGMEVYRPLDLASRSNFLTLAVPASGSIEATLERMRRILWDVDPRMPILSATSIEDSIGDSIARERFVLSLSVAFTICAVVIAAVGVYGVSAYWVARRRRELAIRLAIGASPRLVARSVIGRSVKLAAIGGAIGLAITVAGARVIESMLFGTDPRDPLTLGLVTLLLATVAVVACAVPAVKAARVDPMATLRAE